MSNYQMLDWYQVDANGTIAASGSVQAMHIGDVVPLPGHTVRLGRAHPMRNYESSPGVLAMYTPAQAALRGNTPYLGHAYWNASTMAWEDRRTLALAQSAKKVEVDNEFLRRRWAPILTGGITIELNEQAVHRASLSSLATPSTLQGNELRWMDANEQIHTFSTVAQYLQWVKGAVQDMNQRAADSASWRMDTYGLINAATTPAQVDAITW